jgi:hypothetical protein
MTGLKRGNVVLVWFPNSDLVTFKKRPALVVEANNLGTGLPQVLVSMITSNPTRRGPKPRIHFVELSRSKSSRVADGLNRDDGQSGHNFGQSHCRKTRSSE